MPAVLSARWQLSISEVTSMSFFVCSCHAYGPRDSLAADVQNIYSFTQSKEARRSEGQEKSNEIIAAGATITQDTEMGFRVYRV